MNVLSTTAIVGLAAFSMNSTAKADGYDVSIGGGASYLPSTSIDSLTAKTSYGRFDMQAAMELLPVPGIGTVEIGLAVGTGMVTGSSFGRIRSQLSLDTYSLLGRLRRDLHPRISVFGEVGLGVEFGHLQLEDAASNSARSLEDKGRAAASSLGAGFDLRLTESGRGFDLGIRAAVNYRAVASQDFEATPMSEGSDELLLPTTSAGLGSVNTSGMAFAVGIVGMF